MPFAAVGAVAAGVSAAATVAGTALSATSGPSTKNNNTQQTVDSSHTPWGAQGNNYDVGWQSAAALYNQEMANGPYNGSWYSGLNQNENNAIGNAANYAQGAGQQIAGNAANVGGILTGAAQPYLNNAANMASSGIAGPNGALTGALSNYATGGGNGLSSALNSAATAGATNLAQYNSGLSGVMSQAMADPTTQLANDAQQYENSSAVQSAINSTNAQIGQTLNEQTLPGLNREAAMGGALNSSRAGAAQAMAQEGAGIAEGNADASILNNAYNTGLSTAANQRSSGLLTADNAAASGLSTNGNLALGVGNQQIGAANSGLSNSLNYELGNANTQLTANNQLGTATQTGLIAGNDATTQQQALYNLQQGAGALQQQDANNQLAANLAQYNYQNTYGMNADQAFMNTTAAPGQFYNGVNDSTGTQQQYTTGGNALGGAIGALGSQFANGGSLNNSIGALGNYFNGGGGASSAPSYMGTVGGYNVI